MVKAIVAVEVAVVLNRCPPVASLRQDIAFRAQDHRDEPSAAEQRIRRPAT